MLFSYDVAFKMFARSQETFAANINLYQPEIVLLVFIEQTISESKIQFWLVDSIPQPVHILF